MMLMLIFQVLHKIALKQGMSAGNWCLGGIFLEYLEAEIPEILRIPEAQMKKGILIKKNRCILFNLIFHAKIP